MVLTACSSRKRVLLRFQKNLDYLIADRIMREKMGHAARKTIEEQFSWDSTVKELEKVFEVF